MKTKILKVMGVVLTLVLVLTLVPVTLSAQPTPTTPSAWVNVPIPGAIAGTFVVPSVPAGAATPVDCDFLVMANDGSTMYAVDNAGNNVLRSGNAGQTWIAVTPAAAAFPIHGLAVAPDDPNIVALIDNTDIDAVTAGTQWGDLYVSTDGAAIWAAMPRVSGLAAYTAGTAVQDLDISPAMPWGREYAVCTANGAAIPNGVGGTMAGGDGAAGNVIVYGTGGNPLGWADQGAPAEDYTSVAFTPGYAGYRVIVAVGSDAADTALHIRNTSAAIGQWNAGGGFVGWPVPIADAAAVPPTEAQVVRSAVAVPSDFDPSVGTARRVYASYTGSAASDDVYRVDDISVRRLNVLAGADYHSSSMVYMGTRAAGTLFVGDTGQAQVRRSADPFSALPTWTPATKPPSTGVAANMVSGNTQVVLPPDYDTTNVVFAGTSNLVNPDPGLGNDESALSISHDGGTAFNQLSLIDTIIAAHMDVTPVPDGDVLFLATSDGAAAEPDSVWRSSSSPLGAVWERVDTMVCDAGTGIMRVDPDYASTSAVYFSEVGGAANHNIHYSDTGGDLWAARFAPAAIADLLVESKDVVYAAIGNTVRRSTASGWSWDLPQNGNAGAITMLSLAANGDILVGGTANVGYSQDGGSTFTQIAPAVGGGGAIQVVADNDYATNSLIYASSAVANSGVFRWTIGTSTAWEPLRGGAAINAQFAAAVNPTMSGLATRGDVLFALWDTAGAPSGVERSLTPDAPGQVAAGTFFNTLNAGLGGAEAFNRAPQALKVSGSGEACTLWAIDTAGAVAAGVFAFNDDMALLVPEFNHPAEVFSDPVGGRNTAYTVTWDPISNATTYDYRVYVDEGGTQQVYAQNLLVPANPAAPAVVVPAGNLIAGASYYARFRVRNQTTAAANWTNWSEMTKFDVTGGEVVQVEYLGPQPLGPSVGAQGVPVSGTALTWAPYARATKYEVKLATDSALTDVLGTAQVEGTAYQYDGTLEYSTTYFWSARAIEPVPSDWGPTAHFTTMAEPAPPADDEPPVIIEQPQITPAYIYAIIAVGALLVIAVLVLIVRTRRPM